MTDAVPRKRILNADSLAHGISVMLLLTVCQRAIGLGRQLLVCRYLSPEELGRWNLSFHLILLLAPLLVLGLPGTFGRYSEYYRARGRIRGFIRKLLVCTGILSLVGAVALCLTAPWSSWLVFADASQARLIFWLAPTTVAVISFNAIVELLNSLRQTRSVAWLRFAHALLFSCTAIVLVTRCDGLTISLIASYGVASFATCLLAIGPLCRVWGSLDCDSASGQGLSIWTKMLPFAGWIWLGDLLSNLFSAADRYMIIHLATADAAESAALIGQYHSSRIIPQLLATVGLLLGHAILPHLSHDWELNRREEAGQRLHRTIKGYSLLMTGAGFAVLLCAPWLFSEVLGGKYTGGLAVLPLTLLYCIWFGNFCVAQHYFYCIERAGRISICLVAGLSMNIALNWMLVPTYGLWGGVLATVFANLATLVAFCLVASRHGLSTPSNAIFAGLIPALLALGPFLGGSLFAMALVIGWRFEWVFDHDDKELIRTQLGNVIRRLPIKTGRLIPQNGR